MKWRRWCNPTFARCSRRPLLEAGAQAYFTKPIGMRQFLEVVDTYVAG